MIVGYNRCRGAGVLTRPRGLAWQDAPVRSSGTTIELSASDLSQFLGCRHRTALDLAVAHGQREAPTWVDPAMLVLQQRGLDHERGYVDALRAEGLLAVDLAARFGDEAVAHSLEAMRAGAHVILQAALREGRWFGRPDVLRRVESPSALGAWSYQVIDTKLAKETRGGTVLQLALYSEMLGVAQDAVPEVFHVVTPNPETPVQTFRVRDFAAYFRFIRARLEVTAQQEPDAIAAANHPEPVDHCDVCRWWSVCDKRRRADDHLSPPRAMSGALAVVFQRRATREIEKVDEWWRKNRPSSPDVFVTELERTIAAVAIMPTLGTTARSERAVGVRRVLLRRTRYHVY